MKGLVIKDLLVLRRYAKTIGGVMVFYLLWGILGDQMDFLSGMVCLLCVLMTTTAFSYDAQAKWDRYGASLPVTRRQMVGARYLLSLLLLGVGVLTTGLMLLSYSIVKHSSPEEALFVIVGAAAASLLLVSILIPAIYQYGVEKSRMILMVLVFLPIGAVALLAKMGIFAPAEQTLEGLLLAAPIAVLLLFFASYLLSCRIFSQKEL